LSFLISKTESTRWDNRSNNKAGCVSGFVK